MIQISILKKCLKASFRFFWELYLILFELEAASGYINWKQGEAASFAVSNLLSQNLQTAGDSLFPDQK